MHQYAHGLQENYMISWYYVVVALIQVFHKSCYQFFPWEVDSLVSGECDWEATGWLSKNSLPFHPWNYLLFPSAPQELGSQYWSGTWAVEMSFSVELWGQSGRIWTTERDEESFCRKWHTFQKGFCSLVSCLIDKTAQENLPSSFPLQPQAYTVEKVNILTFDSPRLDKSLVAYSWMSSLNRGAFCIPFTGLVFQCLYDALQTEESLSLTYGSWISSVIICYYDIMHSMKQWLLILPIFSPCITVTSTIDFSLM